MAAAGRYLSFRCASPTRRAGAAALEPGRGASVLEIGTSDQSETHLDEVEVAIQIETRGPRHCDGVLSRLRAAGYTLLFS
jgi:threonine dehydratase